MVGDTPAADLELSLDGHTWLSWRDAHREGEHHYFVATGGLQRARYVRLVGDVFLTWHLREVSVVERAADGGASAAGAATVRAMTPPTHPA